jgi:hypothetical protein
MLWNRKVHYRIHNSPLYFKIQHSLLPWPWSTFDEKKKHDYDDHFVTVVSFIECSLCTRAVFWVHRGAVQIINVPRGGGERNVISSNSIQAHVYAVHSIQKIHHSCKAVYAEAMWRWMYWADAQLLCAGSRRKSSWATSRYNPGIKKLKVANTAVSLDSR